MNNEWQYEPIDWVAFSERLQQAPVPLHAYKSFVSLRFQASILEAAIINYADFALTNPRETATRSLAAARSIAYEAASFLKIGEAVCRITERDRGNCRTHLDKYASSNTGIIQVRDALSHIYAGIAAGSENESILFSVRSGYIEVKNRDGVLVRMLLTYRLVTDAVEMLEGMSVELAKARN